MLTAPGRHDVRGDGAQPGERPRCNGIFHHMLPVGLTLGVSGRRRVTIGSSTMLGSQARRLSAERRG